MMAGPDYIIRIKQFLAKCQELPCEIDGFEDSSSMPEDTSKTIIQDGQSEEYNLEEEEPEDDVSEKKADDQDGTDEISHGGVKEEDEQPEEVSSETKKDQ